MPGSLAARPGRNIATMENVTATAPDYNPAETKITGSIRSVADLGGLIEARDKIAGNVDTALGVCPVQQKHSREATDGPL